MTAPCPRFHETDDGTIDMPSKPPHPTGTAAGREHWSCADCPGTESRMIHFEFKIELNTASVPPDEQPVSIANETRYAVSDSTRRALKANPFCVIVYPSRYSPVLSQTLPLHCI